MYKPSPYNDRRKRNKIIVAIHHLQQCSATGDVTVNELFDYLKWEDNSRNRYLLHAMRRDGEIKNGMREGGTKSCFLQLDAAAFKYVNKDMLRTVVRKQKSILPPSANNTELPNMDFLETDNTKIQRKRITVLDIRRRHVGHFSKNEALEFFGLSWHHITNFIRTGRPAKGMYYVIRYTTLPNQNRLSNGS